MRAEVSEKPCDPSCEGYVPIALDTLCPTPVLNFDLYIWPDRRKGLVLYKERNYRLDSEDLSRLLERGLQALYIPSDSHAAYRRYLFDDVVNNAGAAPAQRYKVLTRATRSAFNAAFRAISPKHLVDFAEQFGTHMSDIICSGDLQPSDLLALMQHDYYTYTHSVNVCTCAVALANMLWDDPGADLQPIAKGSVMHDLGKRHVPRYLLNKRGALSENDREQIQQHARLGFDDLCMREDVSWAGLMAVYQHHEHVDGSGYPAKLTGEEIHEWAQICAIADVFDALTSDRSYRRASRLQDVLEYLDSRAGRHFNKEMVRCWNSAIKQKS